MVLTKRLLLGLVMSQYDPMGIICPLTIILKIELRSLFNPELNLGWDDAIPESLHGRWRQVLSMFLRMGDIAVSRSVRPEGAHDIPEVVGFADGSLSAYSCAIYVRWRMLSKNGGYVVKLLCGKSRVTPVRGITAPRSEISGFLILTRLLKVVISAMDHKPSLVTLAVDSQCTISAVEKSGGLLAPYFASRVSEAMSNLEEVSEETTIEPLQHVAGSLNPADILKRCTTTPDDVR